MFGYVQHDYWSDSCRYCGSDLIDIKQRFTEYLEKEIEEQMVYVDVKTEGRVPSEPIFIDSSMPPKAIREALMKNEQYYEKHYEKHKEGL